MGVNHTLTHFPLYSTSYQGTTSNFYPDGFSNSYYKVQIDLNSQHAVADEWRNEVPAVWSEIGYVTYPDFGSRAPILFHFPIECIDQIKGRDSTGQECFYYLSLIFIFVMVVMELLNFPSVYLFSRFRKRWLNKSNETMAYFFLFYFAFR